MMILRACSLPAAKVVDLRIECYCASCGGDKGNIKFTEKVVSEEAVFLFN